MTNYNVIGMVQFSSSLAEIRQQLEAYRQDTFDPIDRIVIDQDVIDEYPYVDGVGTKLIELQKIINQVDISNCFVLLLTANHDAGREIDFVTKFFSVDPNPIEVSYKQGTYTKTIKKYNNTACQKLWNHLYIGTDGNLNPCCEADHRFPLGDIEDLGVNNKIQDETEIIRQHMAAGHRHRACATCYEKEDRGIKSSRQLCDPADQIIGGKTVDIRLDNICNFKCRMCSEYFSSAIQQETIAMYGKDAVLGYENIGLNRVGHMVKDNRFQKVLPVLTSDITSIYFAGGEPLIMRHHYEILEHLKSLNNTDLTISYNTNLSTLFYKQYDVIKIWQQFSDITVGASIDASGKVAEYMRHGTVWSDIVANIYRIKQDAPHVKLAITSVVSCLTIENLIDLQRTWINQELFNVNDFRVKVMTSPEFLSPAVLPQHHKDRLGHIIREHISRLGKNRLAQEWYNVLQWMGANDYTFALKDFARRTQALDAHRNESFEEIFPDYKDLI